MVLLSALILASHQQAPSLAVTSSTILHALARDGHYKQLIKLLHTTGLDHQVGVNGQNYTLFAPNDAAFAKLPAEARKLILTKDEYGSSIAANLLLRGKYGIMSFTNGIAKVAEPLRHQVKTWNEGTLTTTSTPTGLLVDDAKVLGEIYASNGTILKIDRILVVHMRRPKGDGLQPALDPQLIKWGLAKYTD